MSSNSHDFNLDPTKVPAHVAIIMDGNGRWAKKRLMNRIRGHEKGVDTVRNIVRACCELNISALTLYVFSTENWQRPQSEIRALMALLKRFLIKELPELQEQKIKLGVIGQIHRLPQDVQAVLREAMNATAPNKKMRLNLALSYGGRAEIAEMVRSVTQKVIDGDIAITDIDEQLVGSHLYTSSLPDPDLLIRTSGEMRLSNFLLWQLAYAEIFVTDTLWPDFSRNEFINILSQFQKRNRRFGKVIP